MNALKKLGVILILLFIVGGFAAVFQGISVIWEVLVHIFPIFEPYFEQALEDYLTSAYFVVGIIILLLSSIGVYLSVKSRKILYFIISSIIDVISLISIISNLASCH